jgi:hypothetical protein
MRTSLWLSGRPWRCQAARSGSIPTGGHSWVSHQQKISSLRLACSRVTVPVRHPPAWVLVQSGWLIRPISDGRPGFEDFLDRDLWFCDFLIIKLGGGVFLPRLSFFKKKYDHTNPAFPTHCSIVSSHHV